MIARTGQCQWGQIKLRLVKVIGAAPDDGLTPLQHSAINIHCSRLTTKIIFGVGCNSLPAV